MTRLTFALLVSAPLILTGPAFALPGDLGAELGAAQSFMGLAIAAKDIKTARMHLHEAINCLVGPAGDGFDARQKTPCSGDGAIVDERDQVKKARLIIAKDRLQTGLASEDLRAAQSAAASAQATLISLGSEL